MITRKIAAKGTVLAVAWLLGIALWSACSHAWAQGWQPVRRDNSPATGTITAATHWEPPSSAKTVNRTSFSEESRRRECGNAH